MKLSKCIKSAIFFLFKRNNANNQIISHIYTIIIDDLEILHFEQICLFGEKYYEAYKNIT